MCSDLSLFFVQFVSGPLCFVGLVFHTTHLRFAVDFVDPIFRNVALIIVPLIFFFFLNRTCEYFSFLKAGIPCRFSLWRLLRLFRFKVCTVWLAIGGSQFATAAQSSAGLHSVLVWYMWGRRMRGQVSSCSQRGGHCPGRLLQLVSCHQTKAPLIANSWTAKGLANERGDGVMVFRRVACPNEGWLRPSLCPRIWPWPVSPAPAGAAGSAGFEQSCGSFWK